MGSSIDLAASSDSIKVNASGSVVAPPKSVSPSGIELSWNPKFFNEQLSYARVVADDESANTKGENYEIYIMLPPDMQQTAVKVSKVEIMAVPSLTARERSYNSYSLEDSLHPPSGNSGIRIVDCDYVKHPGVIRFRVSRKRGTNGTPFKKDGELNLLRVYLNNGHIALSPIFNVTTKRAGHKALRKTSSQGSLQYMVVGPPMPSYIPKVAVAPS